MTAPHNKTAHTDADEDSASYAWNCYFHYGYLYYYPKSYEGGAVAVRLIHIAA